MKQMSKRSVIETDVPQQWMKFVSFLLVFLEGLLNSIRFCGTSVSVTLPLLIPTPHKRVITIAITPWWKGCPHIFTGLLPGGGL